MRNDLSTVYVANFGPTETENKTEKSRKKKKNKDIGPVNLLQGKDRIRSAINPLNAKLNPTCHLLALLGAHRILHVSRIRIKFAR